MLLAKKERKVMSKRLNISESTLQMMDSAIENFKNGIAGKPIDRKLMRKYAEEKHTTKNIKGSYSLKEFSNCAKHHP
jgi:hypothetical protein